MYFAIQNDDEDMFDFLLMRYEQYYIFLCILALPFSHFFWKRVLQVLSRLIISFSNLICMYNYF